MTSESTTSALAPAESASARPNPTPEARRWAASPALRWSELRLSVAFGLLFAVVTSWPLVLHIPSHIAPDLGDPVRTAWQVAYVGYALVHHPLHIWTSNAFWPHPLSLAFSDSLLGYGPVAWFGTGFTAALIRYNLLFLFAYTLAFVGPYFLSRELGVGRGAALVAGAAFAYAPFRGNEAGHLHVISSGGIPLSLFLLLRGYRRGSRATIIAGWLVATWQVSLGFTLGLQLSYLIGALAIICLVYWWTQGRPSLPRELVAVTVIGVVVFGAMAIYEGRPYLQVAADYPTARRHLSTVKTYSADLYAFLSAGTVNRVWGSVTSVFRAHVNSKNESALFPGLIIVVLAALGLWRPLLTRRFKIVLVAGIVLCGLFSLGLDVLPGGLPYRILYNWAPGWDGVRVPDRINTLTSLGLALLAAAGANFLIRRFAQRQRVLSAVNAGALAAAILMCAIVAEGAGHEGHPKVPPPPKGAIGVKGPLIWLPTDPAEDRVYQLWSVDGFPQITGGNSTFDLPQLDNLRGGMQDFPDAPGVAKLRGLHVYTVIMLDHTIKGLPVDKYATPEPPYPGANTRKSIAGIPGVTEQRRGDVTIFHISPKP